MKTANGTTRARRRSRLYLLFERALLSAAMTVAALVTERLLLRAIRRDPATR